MFSGQVQTPVSMKSRGNTFNTITSIRWSFG